jgi:vacuolar protein sorting-associated protein 29
LLARQLDADILITGHSHKFQAFEAEAKFFINPGSVTGAYSALDRWVTGAYSALERWVTTACSALDRWVGLLRLKQVPRLPR